jgi:mediator of RNA polymerase II transcription subunit 12, fungi type
MRKYLESRLDRLHMLKIPSVRLATHLYAEHLLDRDHYMDWLVSGLESSTQARLPMWLLITKIYWRDLLRLRKYGRRLVSAILSHHAAVRIVPPSEHCRPLTFATDI